METPSAGPFTPYQRARLLLISSAVLCFVAFWWLGRIFRIPIHPGHEASLFQQPQLPVVLLMVGAALMGCVAVGTAVAGMIRFNAGLLTAGIGLAALSTRGGTIRDVIHHGLSSLGSPQFFLHLAYETATLAAMFALPWLVLLRFHRAGILRDREGNAVLSERGQITLSLLTQTLVTGAFVLGLCTSDAKQQVLAAVAIASFVGSLAAQAIFPATPRSATWLPPLLVGIAGYVLAYFNPAGIETADLTHWSAPLSRPIPIDYAGVGTAAAILGHWSSRQWAEKEGEAGTPQSSDVARPA